MLLLVCAFDLMLVDSYGLCGLLRPLTVYPSEMVYWGVSLLNMK